jgi:hypothetical protein
MKKNAMNRPAARDTRPTASELDGVTLARVRGGSNSWESRPDPRPQTPIPDGIGWE